MRSQPHDNQADDDYPSTRTVEQMSNERLGETVDQESQPGGQGNGRAVPAEFFAHWYDEDTKCVPGSYRQESNEETGSQHVPAVVGRSVTGLRIMQSASPGRF